MSIKYEQQAQAIIIQSFLFLLNLLLHIPIHTYYTFGHFLRSQCDISISVKQSRLKNSWRWQVQDILWYKRCARTLLLSRHNEVCRSHGTPAMSFVTHLFVKPHLDKYRAIAWQFAFEVPRMELDLKQKNRKLSTDSIFDTARSRVRDVIVSLSLLGTVTSPIFLI